MATLDCLKQALRRKATSTVPASAEKHPLSDTQYSAGFDTLVQGPGWTIYQDFIIPQFNRLLVPLFNSRPSISVLEIGPGPKSLLAYIPAHLRRRVREYTAYEPNELFATRLEESRNPDSETECPLPCLETPADIHRVPFIPGNNAGADLDARTSDQAKKYDIILFCHSMYGMTPKRKFIEHALEMLVEQPQTGIVAVFHRDGGLDFDGLVCHQTAFFPSGTIRVGDDDETLQCFAQFIAGFHVQDVDSGEMLRVEWRKVCRSLGQRETDHPGHLSFSAPNIMVTFTRHATSLPELTAQVPIAPGDMTVKNRQARLHRAASILRPTTIQHLQLCVQWALKHETGLTILGGGHSGQCLWPNVVSIDMGGFDKVHLHTIGEDEGELASASSPDPALTSGSLVAIAEAGCKTSTIIRETMAAGVTVPLGSRPSVGAGMWLQGGIGHLARLHGLACDAVVGAVVVSVESSQILCVGYVPSEHQPAGAVRSDNESDLLWALKGAGTNCGIVVSVVFKTYAAPTYLTRNWVFPLNDSLEARRKLEDFDSLVASKLDRNCSADAYLYWEAGQLHLGVSTFESCTAGSDFEASSSSSATLSNAVWPSEAESNIVDGIGLFDTEMYMSGLHGGHSGGKTSSFKRCIFLNHIGQAEVADRLVAAIETRPSPLCYLHLLQGGGAVRDTATTASAFNCRDWDFACVITGVWPRDQDDTQTARSTVQWVYDVAAALLPLSSGAYGADLGQDPRDAPLAAKAFGTDGLHLARLKRKLDPRNILSYACPLPISLAQQKLITLVTGENGAGKDYCAEVRAYELSRRPGRNVTARVASISDALKREYAAATGADLNRLLWDRAYKEQHRPASTRFFQEQVRRRPMLPEQHFLSVVSEAADVDVLFVTGMRDEAPVAGFSHLVPDCRLIEVRVQASQKPRQLRRQCQHRDNNDRDEQENNESNSSNSDSPPPSSRPTLIFENDTAGDEKARRFAQKHLYPFLHEDLDHLANMVRRVAGFPRPAIDFRHVLGIAQQPGGLSLCTSLLQTHFALTDNWANVDAVACCEVGGRVFASALAMRVDVPLVLIREAGKLPPPTLSVVKPSSHISSLAASPHGPSRELRIEMERDVLAKNATVVVVDDVFSTGETLCAVLKLLGEAGVAVENVSVMAVVEFPVHRGRELLRERGFGRVRVQSLLVYGGA